LEYDENVLAKQKLMFPLYVF